MRICGIICEYNPFHNGHAFHIKETKKHGIDGIVCIMSGDFVQRGEPAIVSKHYRAEMALHGGADLVLELPSPYALSSAERFASGAVSILSSLGVIEFLSFGCEAGMLDTISRASEILNNAEFYADVKEYMKTGVSFAAARDHILLKSAPDCAEVLRKPNNLLAAEYLRALPSSITPIAIPRHAVDHDTLKTTQNFASASAIRDIFLNHGISSIKSYLPESSYEILKQAVLLGDAPVSISKNGRIFLTHLKRLSREDWANIPDVCEGLDSRIYNAVSNSVKFDEIADTVKTKRYAHSRIRRILMSAFLDINKYETVNAPCFTRVLACNSTGKTILSLARKKTKIPIITKPATAKRLDISDAFEKEILRSSIYSLLTPELTTNKSEWQKSPKIF